jgi:hydrogenase/urease accessory protein HupE
VENKKMKSLAFALAFSALPAVAHAHPGPHDDIDSVPAMLAHIVSSPDHASWLILAITAVFTLGAIKAAIRIVGMSKD